MNISRDISEIFQHGIFRQRDILRKLTLEYCFLDSV
jgi:hypothetical protein